MYLETGFMNLSEKEMKVLQHKLIKMLHCDVYLKDDDGNIIE